MADLALRVARRFLASNDTVQRIEAIPGYQKNRFLLSLHEQASRGRALSTRQLEVLTEIEAKAGVGKPKVKADVVIDRWGTNAVKDLCLALWKQDAVVVEDHHGVLANPNTLKAVRRELDIDFSGQIEVYQESNADEDDPIARARNSQGIKTWSDAYGDFIKAKFETRKDGSVTVLSLNPSIPAILKKHRIK